MSNLKLPEFPGNQAYGHRARAELATVLRNDGVDQYEYVAESNCSSTDFRIQMSELGQLGWPIDRQFRLGIGQNGLLRHCKAYQLLPAIIASLYVEFPTFKKLCLILMPKEGAIDER